MTIWDAMAGRHMTEDELTEVCEDTHLDKRMFADIRTAEKVGNIGVAVRVNDGRTVKTVPLILEE